MTRDGGETWTNHAGKLPGLPANSWIPQIQASAYHAGEAFVVANNYRMGDFTAYAYRTRDYGASWERIVDDSDVYGYALCIVQDPVEPNLVFLGTEHGLWVSIDNAGTWTQWKHGYPSVSTMDMVIQPREADLVIGTFGRSVYVLDNIRPLREIAASNGRILDSKFKVFNSPTAYLVEGDQQPAGYHSGFTGDANYEGENKSLSGAILTYYLREEKKEEDTPAAQKAGKSRKAKTAPAPEKPDADKKTIKYDSITLHIYDREELIRTLKYGAKTGLNMVSWRLRKKGVQFPNPWALRYGGRRGRGARQAEPAGFPVLPGDYKVVMSCGDQKDSTMVTVHFDPRIDVDIEGMKASEKMYMELGRKAEALNKATTRLSESKAVLGKVSEQLKGKDDEDLKELGKETKAVQDSLKVVWEYIMGKEETKQGIADWSEPTVAVRLFAASRYIRSRPTGPTATEERLMEQAGTVIEKALDMTNAFYRDTWPAYREKVEKTDFKWFKDYEPIEIE
jgi:hypothetical protein